MARFDAARKLLEPVSKVFQKGVKHNELRRLRKMSQTPAVSKPGFVHCLTSLSLSLVLLSTAHSQITFVSSDVTMTVDAFADDSNAGESDSDHDTLNTPDVMTFMDSIGALATTAISGASADATVELGVTASSIDLFGETSAEASGSEFGSAGSFGNFDLGVSFQVTTATEFTADLTLSAENLATGADASVRMFDSGGVDVFSEMVTGADFFEDMFTGTLMPDTYTLRAFAGASAGADAFSSGGNSRALVEVALDFGTPPPPPPAFMFSCDSFPFCPHEIIPKFSTIHGIVPGLADEPLPFWNEGFGVNIFLDTIFDAENGPINADIAVIESAFDGPEDMYPENIFDPGTFVRILLAFPPGSLTANQVLDDLPRSKFLGGLAELVDPEGNVLHTTRLSLIPEPNTCILLMGLALGVLTRARLAKPLHRRVPE